ncbi:hypothetical protein SSX86_014863 [Deinandra increscens subsp. villosa]|uniref:Uncharacterized protein n=1 Tax=Deinandra increscens subsp. villosa TaxID=3103831 RepID=A0AAP0CYZ7_9ASTR
MRDYHHDLQTTRKELLPLSSNRKPKPINTPSKKPNRQQQKSIKRNLNSAFASITEDDEVLNPSEKESIQKISSISDQFIVEICKSSLKSDNDLVSENADVLQHPEQSIEISSVSEAFDSNEDRFTGSTESCIVSSSQLISPSSATAEDVNSFKIESLVNDLRICRESMCQVLNSADLEPKYKRLFDALVKMVIEESHSLHEEKGRVIVVLSFVLAAIGFCLFSDAQSSYNGPPPT